MALVAVAGLTAIAAVGVTTSNFENSSYVGGPELGQRSEQGGQLYVALGDSFSSGEGEPFIDPNVLRERYGADSLDDLQACLMAPANLHTPFCGPDPDWVENDLGWLGDTGTDFSKLAVGTGVVGGLSGDKSFGGNNCHRSAHAYPVRLWQALSGDSSEWRFTFAACSGALSKAYEEGSNGEEPQKNAFQGRRANLVTLGFGGNDSGFGGIVTWCLVESSFDRGAMFSSIFGDAISELDLCKDKTELAIDDKLATLEDSLNRVVGDIVKERLATDGRLVLVGYPRFFPNNPPDSCALSSDLGSVTVGRDSMLYLNDVADRINERIRKVAERYPRQVSLIDTTDIVNGSRTLPHNFCVDSGEDRWVNRLIHSDLQRSMHPKWPYHQEVVRRIANCLQQESLCNPRLVLQNWLYLANSYCIPNAPVWTPASSNEVKLKGVRMLKDWLEKTGPSPAIEGARQVMESRIAYLAAAEKHLVAVLDPTVSRAGVALLNREMYARHSEVERVSARYLAADGWVSALRAAC